MTKIASLLADFVSDVFTLLPDETENSSVNPFRDHPQIQTIIDSLSRQERHHVALISSLSEKNQSVFMKAIAEHIRDEAVPAPLRKCRILFFDINRLMATSHHQEKNAPAVQALIADANTRILLFTSDKKTVQTLNIESYFSMHPVMEPDTKELTALLKWHRSSLEDFHHTVISDEIILHALTLATHYLPGHSRFDKTWELLDSAAARASLSPHPEEQKQKTAVTPHCLVEVVSNRTEIPITHLQNNPFQARKLVEALKKQIFGQDAAINKMASLLQNACIQLQENTGPLCNFLLAGPSDTGKTAMVYAMAKHLFGSHGAVLRINLNHTTATSLSDIRIAPGSDADPDSDLLSAIQKMPYAILFIEDMDHLDEKTYALIQGIFEHGYVFDDEQNKYDFRHAVVIATTRTATDQINELNAALHPSEHHSKTPDLMQLDLMQLVLNKHLHDAPEQNTSWPAPDELCDMLLPELMKHFPESFLQKFNIIPFIPLDSLATENIIRLKIKRLARHLLGSFNIELSFPPEVIQFLTHEAVLRKSHINSLDKLLEQHLYSLVTHEILLHAEDKNRSKRLLIQLNDSGHLLRCEFMAASEAGIYSL
ncbi:MAG TPA: AAA family ATPase [Gammaproteobacteria bacterium]|nr:AAA family ATPase [Gammaproteobacteria bacterium]